MNIYNKIQNKIMKVMIVIKYYDINKFNLQLYKIYMLYNKKIYIKNYILKNHILYNGNKKILIIIK